MSKAPAGFTAAVEAAAGALDALLTDPITVNISVGFDEIGGSPITPPLSEGGPLGEIYPVLRGGAAGVRLAPDLGRAGGDAGEPAVRPSDGAGFYVSSAQEKAWGLLPADGTEVDGEVGFSVESDFNYNPDDRNDPNAVDFIGIAEHELAHALGRVAEHATSDEWSVQDLTRYAATGVLRIVHDGALFLDRWRQHQPELLRYDERSVRLGGVGGGRCI